jgi:amidase
MQRRDFLVSSFALPLAGGALARAFEPPFGSAAEAAAAIRAHKISALELTQAVLKQLDKHNPKLNAVIQRFDEKSLERSKAADAALARKQFWGPLHGVPITIKECFAYDSTPTSAGVPARKDFRPKKNALAVDRLLNAGAIILGKTNIPVSLADWQSDSPNYGVSNNPWDLTRTPGGSTGGGAAALAAGIGFLTLGSDIGGSIRVPAHFCGVYGLKPSLELVSTRGHVPPFTDGALQYFMDLAVVGPLARTAGDLGLALQVLGGPAPEDAKAWKWTMPAPRHKTLKQYRIGLPPDDSFCPVSPDVKAVLDSAVAELERAGCKIHRGWPEGIVPREQFATYAYLLGSWDNASQPAEVIEGLRAAWQKNPKNPWLASAFEPHKHWRAATERRLAARAAWERYFQTHDVFLIPTAFSAAFPHDHSQPQEARTLMTPDGKRTYWDLINWVSFATLAGIPATVAPVGRTTAGLPVGIQILGPWMEDGSPIQFAALMEPVTGGFQAPKGY